MSWRLAIATLATLTFTGAAAAQPGPPPDFLDQASGALDAGEYATAEAAARASLRRSLAQETQDVAERAEAYRILGLSLYYLGEPRHQEARAAFLEYLKLVPDAQLDPRLHKEETVAFFTQVRIDNKDIIAGARPEPDKRRFAVNLVPPFGQFQNKQPVKGAIVGGLEIALIATNITTFFVLRSWCLDDGTCPGREKKAEVLQVVNVGSGLVFAGVYIYGVVDGWRGYRDWQRQQSSLLRMSFQLAPTTDGAMATFGGTF